MRPEVVVGAGFGDEGKGATVDGICRRHDVPPLVVRFSGGHQAGHTVVAGDGRRHVFSQVGSGAFAGSPTFWSRHCTFEPLGFLTEVAALRGMGVEATVYIDPDAPLVTPWDRAFNQITERINRHGSCGVGFAATLRRHADCPLRVGDVLHPRVLEVRLRSVIEYYRFVCPAIEELDPARFLGACALVKGEADIIGEIEVFAKARASRRNVVFEGSQGILLDMRHGFYPHMTMSRTTSANAVEMAARNGMQRPIVWAVTRAYQTRHGNGPMTNEHLASPLRSANTRETNVTNPWQGSLRYATLDLDMLRYAVDCDRADSGSLTFRGLVVTCLDQVDPPGGNRIPATDGGTEITINANAIARSLGLSLVLEQSSEVGSQPELSAMTVKSAPKLFVL